MVKRSSFHTLKFYFNLFQILYFQMQLSQLASNKFQPVLSKYINADVILYQTLHMIE